MKRSGRFGLFIFLVFFLVLAFSSLGLANVMIRQGPGGYIQACDQVTCESSTVICDQIKVCESDPFIDCIDDPYVCPEGPEECRIPLNSIAFSSGTNVASFFCEENGGKVIQFFDGENHYWTDTINLGYASFEGISSGTGISIIGVSSAGVHSAYVYDVERAGVFPMDNLGAGASITGVSAGHKVGVVGTNNGVYFYDAFNKNLGEDGWNLNGGYVQGLDAYGVGAGENVAYALSNERVYIFKAPLRNYVSYDHDLSGMFRGISVDHDTLLFGIGNIYSVMSCDADCLCEPDSVGEISPMLYGGEVAFWESSLFPRRNKDTYDR